MTHNALITPEDFDRIARLEKERPEDQEVHWLCRLARKLADLKPTETAFPEYLVLINHFAENAMQVRYAETVAFQERILTWIGPAGQKAHLLEHELACDVTDAFLCVRPYIKLLSPKTAGTLEQLERLGIVTVSADESVLFNGAVAELLVGEDGYGVRRKPFTLRYEKDPKSSVFGTGTLDASGTSHIPSEHGVFLAHKTKILIELSYPLRNGDELQLATGLVMARYTTRDSKCGVMRVGA